MRARVFFNQFFNIHYLVVHPGSVTYYDDERLVLVSKVRCPALPYRSGRLSASLMPLTTQRQQPDVEK